MKLPWSKPKPSIDQEAIDEAMLLDKDILERELNLIDAQFKMQAQRAKKEHLLEWLQRDKPRVLNPQDVIQQLQRETSRSSTPDRS